MRQQTETAMTAAGRNLSLIRDLANPNRFLAFAGPAIRIAAAATAVALAAGLWLALRAPEDYQQGATVLIMFIHVPAAWLSMFAYGVMTMAAVGYLVWRHPLADAALRAAAPIGAVFTLLALVTGSLWGKPMWGTWWVWDARLTSVFVLLLIYLGLIAFIRAAEEPSAVSRPLAVLTLIGSVNLPVIKFSVDWWNTLHQPASVARFARPAMDAAFLHPLLTMALAYTLLFVTLHLAAIRNEILDRRLRALRQSAAHGAEAG
jgi:heme exporter protein C